MKIAVCGVWHVHAGDYTEKAKLSAEVIGVYDEDPERRRDFADKHGLKEFDSFQQLLDSEAEGVIVCSSTESHTGVITAVAKAKKHIFTEKVLALNYVFDRHHYIRLLRLIFAELLIAEII